MPLQNVPQTLSDSFSSVGTGVVNFLPIFVVALLVFLIGLVIANLFGRGVTQILEGVKIDRPFTDAGFDKLMERAGYKLRVSGFIGMLVKWFVIIVFLIASLDMLSLTQVNEFLSDVVLRFIPQVAAALFILLVGAIVAQALERAVVGSAKSANMTSAHFLGVVTRWSIWVFAALAAFFQLGVAAVFVQTFFTGIVIAIALAIGLAFGLGGQAAAAKYLERLQKNIGSSE